MAKTFRPYLPEQDLLLPPSLLDWLPENHLAYFVSDVVDRTYGFAALRAAHGFAVFSIKTRRPEPFI